MKVKWAVMEDWAERGRIRKYETIPAEEVDDSAEGYRAWFHDHVSDAIERAARSGDRVLALLLPQDDGSWVCRRRGGGQDLRDLWSERVWIAAGRLGASSPGLSPQGAKWLRGALPVEALKSGPLHSAESLDQTDQMLLGAWRLCSQTRASHRRFWELLLEFCHARDAVWGPEYGRHLTQLDGYKVFTSCPWKPLRG